MFWQNQSRLQKTKSVQTNHAYGLWLWEEVWFQVSEYEQCPEYYSVFNSKTSENVKSFVYVDVGSRAYTHIFLYIYIAMPGTECSVSHYS